MILCNNCGANIEADKTFCGECGARNPAVPGPPAPPPTPPKPVVGKFLLVLVGLLSCFVVGALLATAVFLGSRSRDSQTNANYLYANANTSYGSNSNANVYTSNTANVSPYNTNTYTNTNMRSNMNTGNMNTGYGNTNVNSNRRPSMSPFENAEYKVLNNQYLTGSEVSGLSAYQLRLLRNTVFAKYGRVFTQNDDLQDYFDGKSWYRRDESYTKPNAPVNTTNADEYNLKIIQAAEAGYTNQ